MGSSRLLTIEHQRTPAAGAVPIESGRVVHDRYVIQERLGTGARGSVFKALDRHRSGLPQGSQHVAIKILPGSDDDGAERLGRVRRDFYRAQTLSHPNIVKLHELDRAD